MKTEYLDYQSKKSKIVKISESDSEFQLTDGWAVYPRAMMHISPDCPMEYRKMIAEAKRRGWITPVAYIKDSEYTWGRLQDE